MAHPSSTIPQLLRQIHRSTRISRILNLHPNHACPSPISSRLSLSTHRLCQSQLYSRIPFLHRPLTTSSSHLNPQAPPPEPTSLLPLSTYHALSDTYIDTLLSQLESLSDDNPAIDVEYSAGVLTLTFPPHGTYVLNKQPPNRQIWLSSPTSGPKRYDWVIEEGAATEEKGKWVYLRDGSTLDGLLEEEIGVRMEEVGTGEAG